ncbi:MAG TPA: hypothetical protein VN132_16115 [Bdellovibrio sp.]|nr:hypothetical protein [Bdellovibrio sp.]
MKTLFTLIAISLISPRLFATPIPQNRLDDYKEAVGLVMRETRFVCTTTINQGGKNEDDPYQSTYQIIFGDIDSSSSADLNSDGNQPLLTFLIASGHYKWITTVTTTPDQTSIVEIKRQKLTYYEWMVNRSKSLGHPDIGTDSEWLVVKESVCVAKK